MPWWLSPYPRESSIVVMAESISPWSTCPNPGYCVIMLIPLKTLLGKTIYLSSCDNELIESIKTRAKRHIGFLVLVNPQIFCIRQLAVAMQVAGDSLRVGTGHPCS